MKISAYHLGKPERRKKLPFPYENGGFFPQFGKTDRDAILLGRLVGEKQNPILRLLLKPYEKAPQVGELWISAWICAPPPIGTGGGEREMHSPPGFHGNWASRWADPPSWEPAAWNRWTAAPGWTCGAGRIPARPAVDNGRRGTERHNPSPLGGWNARQRSSSGCSWRQNRHRFPGGEAVLRAPVP